MSAVNEAFPSVEPGLIPFGSRVLVQIRSAKKTSSGGIILHSETRETEIWNTQIAKVVKLGPLAFKNRNTMESWPEGDWCKPDEFVRVPKYGGDRWKVPHGENGDEEALFVIFNDLDIVGGVVGDPLAIKAFI
jgi:co-chaperonin GroES (HSP10)